MTTKESFVSQMTALASAKAELEKAWTLANAEAASVAARAGGAVEATEDMDNNAMTGPAEVADAIEHSLNLCMKAAHLCLRCERIWDK